MKISHREQNVFVSYVFSLGRNFRIKYHPISPIFIMKIDFVTVSMPPENQVQTEPTKRWVNNDSLNIDLVSSNFSSTVHKNFMLLF